MNLARLCLLFAALALAPVLAAGEGATGGAIRITPHEPEVPDEDDRPPVRWALVRRLPEEPEIDGDLDLVLWEEAEVLDGFVFDGPEDKVRLWVAVGHRGGAFYVAGRAEGDVGEDDRFEVLFDTWGDRESMQRMAVRGDGARSFRTRVEGRVEAWRPRAEVATRTQRGGWTFEARIPREAFADPDNDAFGFNVLYRGQVSAAWNPPAPSPDATVSLGRLAYEHRPLSIVEARVGVLTVGENRLRLAVANAAPERRRARLLLNVESADGRSTQRRYRFEARPEGETLIAVGFPLVGQSPFVLEVFLLDPDLRRLAAVYRRGMEPAESLEMEVVEQDADGLTARFAWPFPPVVREGLTLVATLTEVGGAQTLVSERLELDEHGGAIVRFSTADLAPGDYRARANIQRGRSLIRTKSLRLRVGEEGLEEAEEG